MKFQVTRFLPFLIICPLLSEISGKIRFNRDIRPILSEHCFACHGPDSNTRKAKLRLDEMESATKLRDGEKVVFPGNPGVSILMHRILSEDPDEIMPPTKTKRRLSDKQKKILGQWISEGAGYERHWSYEKPKRPPVPEVAEKSWPLNAVDKFILSRLENENLRPMGKTDRYALLRRVSLDLTGLPPSIEEVESFVKDASSDAYERQVDRLLSSKAYGEHWARHWLDLARYADSAGYADDQPRTIWGYRDWVIRAFNDNKPFDELTIEQLAGDLLPNPSNDQLTATAFHRNTQTNNEGGTNDEEFRNAAIVDRVNTTMAVWMGTTMNCAQCHDHKYDPLSQEEYFRLFAILNNTQDADRRDESPTLKVFSMEQKKNKEEIAEKLKKLEAKLAKFKARTPASFQPWIEKFSNPIHSVPTEYERTKDGTFTVEIPEGRFEGIELVSSSAIKAQAAFELDRPDGKPGQLGRFVRVTNLVDSGFLHLAEVEVFSGQKNLSPEGTAKQISTDFAGPAKYANDGNKNGKYTGKSVSHTGLAKNPWWEVDLGKEFSISKVNVWNRTDNGTAERIKKFQIEVFDHDHKVVWKREINKVPKPSCSESLDSARLVSALPFPRIGKASLFQFATPLERDGDKFLSIQVKNLAQSPIKGIRLAPTLPTRLEANLPKPVFSLLSTPSQILTKDQIDQIKTYHVSDKTEFKKIEKQIADVGNNLRNIKPFTTVPILRELDTNKRRQTHIQIRGNFLQKDREVSSGFPSVFHKGSENPDRMNLAKWLVSAENPLTARVIANRYWEALFGTGIVASSEEFGSQGELPSHPELLDWLATELIRLDWDLKEFLKLLVSSATYRQDSRCDQQTLDVDPYNRLLARGPRLRLSAEMVRDQALYAGGLLSRRMYGPPIKPPQPSMGLSAAFGPGLDWQTSKGEEKFRRGIYVHWRRSNPYPSMVAFDAPNRFVCNVRRSSTNTPLQALVALNDPVYVEAAQALARRMIAEGGANENSRLRHGFRLCLTRNPYPSEIAKLSELLKKAMQSYEQDENAAKQLATVPIGPIPSGMKPVELASYTVVSNIMLNLDEVFQKR